MDDRTAAESRLEEVLDRLDDPEVGVDEDEIFEALDELTAALDAPPRVRAAALVEAVAPFCRRRPDLEEELLRYPARPLDEMGFVRARWALDWLEQTGPAPGDASGFTIPMEVRRAAPALQRNLDELREGRESWEDPSADPPPLLAAWRLAGEGREEEAAEIFEELAGAAEYPVLYRFEAARLRARAGDPGSAHDLLEAPDLPVVLRGRLLALVGERDRAVRTLEEILEETPDYALEEEPDFEPLRGYLPYERLRRGGDGGGS